MVSRYATTFSASAVRPRGSSYTVLLNCLARIQLEFDRPTYGRLAATTDSKGRALLWARDVHPGQGSVEPLQMALQSGLVPFAAGARDWFRGRQMREHQ